MRFVVGNEACGVLHRPAPHVLVGQLEQQDAVVVFFHQQPKIVVFALQLRVLVGQQHGFQVAVNFLLHLVGRREVQIPDPAGVHPIDKIADGVGLAGHAEQGARQFTAFHPGEWVACVEQAVEVGPGADQRVSATGADLGAVFSLQAPYKGRFGDFRAAVATHLFGQFTLAVFKRRQLLLVDQFEDVEAVIRANRPGQIADFFQPKRRLFKRLDHLARSEPGEEATLGGGGGVFAVLQRQGVEVLAAPQQAKHFLNASFGVGHLVLRGVARHPHHDVRHLHLTVGLAFSIHLQNVVAKTGAHHLTDVAHLGVERRALERVHHLEGREPSEVSAVAGHRRVLAAAFGAGHGLKVFSGCHARPQPLNAVPRLQGVGGRSLGVHAHKDVACPHFLILALEGFGDQGVQQLCVHQIGTGQLGAVPCQFLLESFRSVHAQGFRLTHLQLEVDEQLHVLVEGFDGVHAVPVVLAKHVLKVSQRHAFAGDVKHVGVLGEHGRGHQGQRRHQTGEAGEECGGLHGH